MPEPASEAEALAELRSALIASSVEHGAIALRHLELAGAPGSAAHAEHRALAFVYQWCFLLERPTDDVAAVREIVSDPISIRLPDGRELTEFEQVAAWHEATSHAVAVTTHTVVDFKLAEPEAGCYDVTLDFVWQGITSEDQAMTARTHHEWTLTDAGERFPRLASFVVSAVRPFAPSTAVDALADLRSVATTAAD